jgi:seryl-tRNA synthetase
MNAPVAHAACTPLSSSEDVYGPYREALIAEKLLIPLGVRGLYARGGDFEKVVEHFDRVATEAGNVFQPEVMRFPPVFARKHYTRLSHIRNFPDLMGSVDSFMGADKEHRALLAKLDGEQRWEDDLVPSEVMLVPAGCYPLYPTAENTTMAPGGRRVDTEGFIFRHEPSDDPARMQLFRQREFVRLGTPQEALDHRDYWLAKGLQIFGLLGLPVEKVVANDPFFGRGGKVQKAMQIEQVLKWEIVVPICSTEKPTAISSCNYHLDTFGASFGIKTADGEVAHTACVGFGLERIALALFKHHGLRYRAWPQQVRDVLELG